MRLFGRKSEPVDPAVAISEFWAWWAEARPRVEAADDKAELMAPAVAALDPGLVWEIGNGRGSLFSLVVSSAANPELRSLAHRWAKAAPEPDAMWEYHPSRQAASIPADVRFPAGPHEFDMARFVVALRVPPGSPRVDISAYHPIFEDIDDDTRMETAMLALDRLLGEDDVARWVGDITAAQIEPIDALPAIHLPAVVADVAEGFQDEQWALLEGTTARGKKLTATARYPLRPVDYPLYDHHIAITLPYRKSDADGLPAGDSLDALNAFHQTLTAALSPGVVAAHVSSEGVRTFHVYADPTGTTERAVRDLVWKEGRPAIVASMDPEWSAVAHFLT